jgi:lipopolysaccharide biosynthesis regulator YciM
MAKFSSRRRTVLEDPEEVLNLAQRWLTSAKRQWKWLAVGAVVLLTVVAAGGMNRRMQAAREDRAAAELAKMRPRLTEANPENVKALKELVAKYSGAKAAFEAELLQANLLYQMKKYGEAARTYESLLQAGDPGWQALVAESLSYCYEGMGDFKKAAATLRPVAEQSTGAFQAEVMQRLALLYEKAGDPKEAVVYWRKLLDLSPKPALVAYLKGKVAAAEAQAVTPKK